VSVCLSVCVLASVIRQAVPSLFLQRVMLSSVACLAVPYFPTLSYKWHSFRKKYIEHKMSVLISFTILSETFLILRRDQWDIIMNVRRFLCKVPVIIVRFEKKILNFSTDFRKILEYKTSWESFQWVTIVSCGQTNTLEEANSSFSRFCKRA
jgi:hypothetical protein